MLRRATDARDGGPDGTSIGAWTSWWRPAVARRAERRSESQLLRRFQHAPGVAHEELDLSLDARS